ncbi:MAG: hypothetical protein J1F22_05025 [Lachnospiraceae bacterium]|nr:hypothetical protein [Lachnospiraceae bacterium]
MKGKLTINQCRAILICSGILILACTFFFLFQRNSDTIQAMENETRQYKNQVNYLSSLQMQVNEMQKTTPALQTEMDAYMKKFSNQMPQIKAISYIDQMMVKTGVKITSIKPGKEQRFLEAGKFISVNSEGVSPDAEAQPVTGGAVNPVEANPQQQVTVDEMIGKAASYEIEMNGSMKQIMKALDWVSGNDDHMSVTSSSFSFDASTGKLSGSVTVSFYAMNGNGRPYEEPNISGITIGTDNIFGTFND